MSSAGIGALPVSGEKAGVERRIDAETGDFCGAVKRALGQFSGARIDGGEQPEVRPLAAM